MKTHLLLKVMLMAGLLLAGACTPTGQEEGEYTLSSDKTSVNINEEVTFTVKSEEGRDVTSDGTSPTTRASAKATASAGRNQEPTPSPPSPKRILP